jgi:glycosyltransferase involved in cell wall biosynthesis
MPGLYAASDVVVLTSDNEGTPVSLIEAGASGVPVVTTDVGGARSVVRDGSTGFVVAAADEEAFAARVRELLVDDELSGRLGAAAQAHVRERFSVDRLVRDLDALYRELLAQATAG